ncbi:hypothetical protein BH09SUM1_BH09SUM1_10690 [soil metagenome]
MRGLPFVLTALYLLLLVSYVMTLLEDNATRPMLHRVLHQWGKFLLLLVILGAMVQVLTWISG